VPDIIPSESWKRKIIIIQFSASPHQQPSGIFNPLTSTDVATNIGERNDVKLPEFLLWQSTDDERPRVNASTRS
jgi:hypothetical protein